MRQEYEHNLHLNVNLFNLPIITSVKLCFQIFKLTSFCLHKIHVSTHWPSLHGDFLNPWSVWENLFLLWAQSTDCFSLMKGMYCLTLTCKLCDFLIYCKCALAGVAPWIERRLRTTGSPVRFPIGAHAWVAGLVPSGGHVKGNHTLIFLSLSFSFPSPLSKNK